MEHLDSIWAMQRTAAMANLYLLVSIGLCPPTQELAQGLADGSYFADYADCLAAFAPADLTYASAAYKERDVQAVQHELGIEYTRLFISPKRELVPIYESVLVHPDEKVSMFINPTAMHCEQLYRKTGFAFEEKGKFPGDHVGIELRYAACLLARRAMALSEGKEEEAAAAMTAYQDFAAQHLARFMKAFSERVFMHAQTPFYMLMAEGIGLLAAQL